MRSLVKGDCGIPCSDPSQEQPGTRRRAWRRAVRRVIALLCMILAGFFMVQLFKNAGVSNSMSSAASPEWDSPSSVFSWLRWNVNSIGLQFRNEIKGAIPFGNLAVILKLACCAVAAAVFLRGPNRT
jgi:hypothetical protein